jgi:hypothetical protein
MKLNYFVPLLLCIVIISCGRSTGKYDTTDSKAVTKNLEPPSSNEKSFGERDKASGLDLTAADTAAKLVFQQAPPVIDFDKQIIKTASIETECEDYALFNRKLHALVKQYGGWIAGENENQQNNAMNNSLSIKVPVAQFEDLVNGMGGIGGKIVSKSITTQDVTGEVVDAEGRMKVKKVMRDKYVAMLESAKKMPDVLAVQEKIDDMHEEIEMNGTRAQALKRQAAYSTINIHYYQPLAIVPGEDTTPGIGRRILTAATTGAAWLGDVLIGIVSIWPMMLVGLLLFYFIRRKIAQSVAVKTKEEQQ